jgi:hypothetical protein
MAEIVCCGRVMVFGEYVVYECLLTSDGHCDEIEALHRDDQVAYGCVVGLLWW